MKKYIYFSILTVLFLSCKSSKAINNQDIDLNCEKMVVEIVRSSSLDWKRFPNASTRIDRAENDSSERKLYNITYDLENPKKVDFNKKLVNKNKCKILLNNSSQK